MAPPGWFYGKVIDNLGLKERPPYSAKYEKHAEANKSTEVGQLRYQKRENIKRPSDKRVEEHRPEKVRARAKAKAEVKAKKEVTDGPGLHQSCMIAYIKILERGAQIQPPCDECKRSKTDCIKVKKCCRECNGKHYKCSWNNITAQELQDNLLVLQLVREKEMESGSEGLKEETISTSYAPQQKDQDSAKPTMEQPTINQVFPHQEAASRKAYHSSEPSEVHVNHVDPTVAPCKRYKDEDQDEGSSRKDDTTSLGDVSPRQPQILDAETPRKKLKLFQAGYYRPSATGHSDNHSSSSGNLDGAPGKPGIGIAGSNRGQHEPDTDMETPRS